MKLFVWDFHGVLEKDNEKAVLETSNKSLEQSGYMERFTLDMVKELYGQKWYEYFEYLLPKKQHKDHLELQNNCYEIAAKNPNIILDKVKPNDYAVEVLEAIAEKHCQILISNSTTDSLKFFLDAVNLTKYFQNGASLAVDNYHTEIDGDKKIILKEYLYDKKFDAIISIGDNPKDIELTSVAGGISYQYVHPGWKFRNCSPDYKINNLREVLREV